MAGFLLGAAGMFAVTYSTQAILPRLSADFHVSPSKAGLTISVVVLALACGAWNWGPFSDRYGRKRSIVLASVLLVAPTIGVALAPSFALLLACRALQGLCMPGLLTAGVPYITEVFAPRIGGRAMGYYVTALVAGGLIGRIGVALLAAGLGWRWGVGLLAILPLAAALVMHRSLRDLPLEPTGGRREGLRRQLRNRALLQAAAAGSAFSSRSSAPSRTSSTGWSGRRSGSGPRPAVSSSRSGSSACSGPRWAGSPTGSAGGCSPSARSCSRPPASS